jgi:hypothetical protein
METPLSDAGQAFSPRADKGGRAPLLRSRLSLSVLLDDEPQLRLQQFNEPPVPEAVPEWAVDHAGLAAERFRNWSRIATLDGLNGFPITVTS